MAGHGGGDSKANVKAHRPPGGGGGADTLTLTLYFGRPCHMDAFRGPSTAPGQGGPLYPDHRAPLPPTHTPFDCLSPPHPPPHLLRPLNP